MEEVRVFVRDLGIDCSHNITNETKCGKTATTVTLSPNIELYTCHHHSPVVPDQHAKTTSIIELPILTNPQAAISSLQRRVEWSVEDFNSSTAKVATKLLEALPRLRETDPVVAIELLYAFSFAWNNTTDYYIEESLREQEDSDQ